MTGKITFKQVNENRILILGDDIELGQIITPSDNLKDKPSIQICGFSDAYNLWGCGIYEGLKDIQLVFGSMMEGETTINSLHSINLLEECCKCYRKPCQCENKEGIPFNIKSTMDMQNNLDTMEMLKEKEIQYTKIREQNKKRMEEI